MSHKLITPEGKEITCIENINDLRISLCETYDQVRAGVIERAQAEALSNVAGKIISTLKVELVNAKLKNETPQIGFIE